MEEDEPSFPAPSFTLHVNLPKASIVEMQAWQSWCSHCSRVPLRGLTMAAQVMWYIRCLIRKSGNTCWVGIRLPVVNTNQGLPSPGQDQAQQSGGTYPESTRKAETAVNRGLLHGPPLMKTPFRTFVNLNSVSVKDVNLNRFGTWTTYKNCTWE